MIICIKYQCIYKKSWEGDKMNGTVSTIIIVAILAVIVFFAIKNSIPHFKGEGSCCGGSGGEELIKPKKLKNIVAVKVLEIEGMHCENCYRRVQNALNSIEGVNAKVHGSRKQAVVKMDKDMENSELEQVVSRLGYKVVSIKK